MVQDAGCRQVSRVMLRNDASRPWRAGFPGHEILRLWAQNDTGFESRHYETNLRHIAIGWSVVVVPRSFTPFTYWMRPLLGRCTKGPAGQGLRLNELKVLKMMNFRGNARMRIFAPIVRHSPTRHPLREYPARRAGRGAGWREVGWNSPVCANAGGVRRGV